MNNNFNNNKNIALAITIIAMISLSSIFTYFGLQEKEISINKEIIYKKHQLELVYLKQINVLKQTYSKKIKDFLQNEDILKAFDKRDRAELSKIVLPYLAKFKKEEPNFELICFGLPTSKAFFRAHKPSFFGDNIDHLMDVQIVNKDKREMDGFMLAKLGLYYRVTTPIYYKNKYIGLVSFGVNINYVNDFISNKFNSEVAILINTKRDQKKKWFKRLEEGNIGNYTIISSTDDIISQSSDKLNTTKQTIKVKIKDKLYFVHKDNNIYNMKNKKIAKILLLQDITKESQEYNNYLYKSIITAFILLVIVITILIFTFNKLINIILKSNSKLQQTSKDIEALNLSLETRIEDEVSKNRDKDKQLYEQSKMASMGEMIGNIAHQWRQPLSVISTGATGLLVHKECDILSDEFFQETCESINTNAQYLSKTIDDFRNFIKGDRVQCVFDVEENIDSFLQIVKGSTKNEDINIILDIQKDIKINSYPNELMQCCINIFNNAKDILNFSEIKHRYIFIKAFKTNKNIIITIKDNGGGIPEDILPKIFEPYFTTKHQSQGTGLGLHMTYNLVVEGMNGNIEAINEEYRYNNHNYKGAKFIITLPI